MYKDYLKRVGDRCEFKPVDIGAIVSTILGFQDTMRKRACYNCLKNCTRLHGEEDEDEELIPICSSGAAKQNLNAVSEPNPSLLRKMTELSMTSALQMPASFVKGSFSRVPKAVTLEGPSKRKWSVDVGITVQQSIVEFRDGWKKFVADHILQVGDQLCFTLTGESHLRVMIYDESGYQKGSAEDAINLPSSLKQMNEIDGYIEASTDDHIRSTTPKQLKDKEAHTGCSDPIRNYGIIPQLSEVKEALSGASEHQIRTQTNKPVSRHKLKVRKRQRTDNHMSMKPAVVNVVDDSSESELRNSDTPKVSKLKGTAAARGEILEEHTSQLPERAEKKHVSLLPPQKLIGGKVISERRPITPAEVKRVWTAAQSLELENPKLVVRMSKAYVYAGFWMAISRPFARAHLPHETKELTFLNKAGHKWTVKWLYKGTNGAGGFSGGWRGFSLDHRLEEGDVCVFEILNETTWVILVHIFRALWAGDAEEDVGDYRPSPSKARNVEELEGNKRKWPEDAGCSRSAGKPDHTPSEKAQKVHMTPSSSKKLSIRAPSVGRSMSRQDTEDTQGTQDTEQIEQTLMVSPIQAISSEVKEDLKVDTDDEV